MTPPASRLTFAEFMDWALYDPDQGYYGQGRVQIQTQGDFVTASTLSADFGELLAEQWAEMGERLGEPFTVLEMGAGDGTLAQAGLRYLKTQHPEFFQSLTYAILEISPALRERQRRALEEFGEKAVWLIWDEIPDQSLRGCCFSNELVDAFPVHRVIWQGGRLQEIYTVWDGESFREEVGALSTPDLSQYFQDLGVTFDETYPEGYRTEVNLAARRWLAQVSRKLSQGYLLTIDYGYSAEKYYHPQRRQGTLQCYAQNRYHDNPYLQVGAQDITSHVNFTALEQWGETYGLKTLGFTRQALFLMNLGLDRRLAALSSGTYPLGELLSRREALHQLIDPQGLGNFGVLLQGKGVGADSLTGFQERR